MKILSLSLLLTFVLTFSVLSSITAQTKDSAKMELNEMVHDFGTIHQNDACTYNLKVTNIGNIPLIILNASTTCGCDMATWPREPILPGKSAFVKYIYDSNRIGHFEKTMSITSNATIPSIIVKFKGIVLRASEKAEE